MHCSCDIFLDRRQHNKISDAQKCFLQTQITLTAKNLNANVQVPTSSYLSNFISNRHKTVPMLAVSDATLHVTSSSQINTRDRGMLGIHLSLSGLQA